MKIAYIVSRFPKITETFVLYEVIELLHHNVAVDIYPLIRERSAIQHPDADKIQDKVHYTPFLSFQIINSNIYFLTQFPSNYIKTVWCIFHGTFRKPKFLLRSLAIFPKAVYLASRMKQANVNHVHAHFATHPTTVAFIIKQLTGIPYSFTAHAHDIQVNQLMLKKKIHESSAVVTISHFNKILLNKAIKTNHLDKIHIIRCGVDAETFSPRAASNDFNTTNIICVGAFEEKKGHRYLIDACHYLDGQDSKFICHLVGDGPLRQKIIHSINVANLQEKVIVHGALPRPRVADLIRQADIAVLASIEDKTGKMEGIPVALMEAMSTGLPVVSTYISGIPELVENDTHGYLVPPKDAVALAKALKQLIEHPDLRLKMGAKGQEKVLAEYNLRINTIEKINLISGLVEAGTETMRTQSSTSTLVK